MLKQKISTSLNQKQTLNQHIQQLFSIIQLSCLDLEQYINQKLETNPLLQNPDDETIQQDYNFSKKEDFIDNYSSLKSLDEHILEQIHLVITNFKEKKMALVLAKYIDQNG